MHCGLWPSDDKSEAAKKYLTLKNPHNIFQNILFITYTLVNNYSFKAATSEQRPLEAYRGRMSAESRRPLRNICRGRLSICGRPLIIDHLCGRSSYVAAFYMWPPLRGLYACLLVRGLCCAASPPSEAALPRCGTACGLRPRPARPSHSPLQPHGLPPCT